MNHINEKTLEAYLLEDLKTSPDRDIEDHLRQCEGCKALYEEMKTYYGEVSQLRKEREEESHALTLRRMIVQMPPFGDVERKITLPARAILYALQYPKIFTGAFVGLLAATLFALMPNSGPTDTNPGYARAKDEFLVVYNRDGEELWRKHVGVGFDFERLQRETPFAELDQHITVVDVDGDGRNEIVTIVGWVHEPILDMPNTILCYNDNGTLRWKYNFNREMTFGAEKFSDDYRVFKMVVGSFGQNGKAGVIALAGHLPYFPVAIVRLDARKGDLIEEYWHPGVTGLLMKWDMEKDGVEDLISAGCNNGFNQAHLLVLDPRHVRGHSPAPEAYIPHGMPPGNEKYYLLLPQTDLNKASPDKRNVVSALRMTNDGLLEVHTVEIPSMKHGSPGLLYYFDSDMRCVRVEGNDYLEEFHRKMEEEGKLKKGMRPQYYEDLRQGVRYWNGEKFVKEAVMNGRYRDVIAGKE